MFEQIGKDVISAMKSGDKEKLLTLRSLSNDCKLVALGEGSKTPSDEHCITALKKSIKRMESSIDLFKQGGRNDLVDNETYQLDIIKMYLPVALSESETKDLVTQAISETGATTKKEMSKVMTFIKNSGKMVDNKLVVKLVQEHLV
jgi:uncharacterized protein YqeY